MHKTPAILCLDVEDPIALRSHQAAQWICQQISAQGLTASCFLVAEKVRAWERLGLREVIEAVRPHDLCFHTSRHSFHPTITEISEALPAHSGAELLWGWERPGWEATERIMGKPVNHWGRSGGSWSPALAVMLGQRGHALMYSPIHGDDSCRPCWFADALNFADYFEGLDGFYHDDAQFPDQLSQYQEQVEKRLAAGAPYLGLFCCHPTRVVHHEFWDVVNFLQGHVRTPEQWQDPPAITPEQEETARRNLRRYLEWIAGDERFEVVGFSQLVGLFAQQKTGCSRGQLLEICHRIADQQEVIFTDHFTAAEILGMMVELATHPGLDSLTRHDLMAPPALPTQSGRPTVTPAEVLAAALTVQAHLRATHVLPEQVDCTEGSLYIADYFVALAQALLARDRQENQALVPQAAQPYPAIADKLAQQAAEVIRSWDIHRPDLDLSWIERDTRLLSWTFKPAWTSEELRHGAASYVPQRNDRRIRPVRGR